jgi:DHA1 family inner membrane transport protein
MTQEAEANAVPARTRTIAELALAVGGFAIGTGEFASMGLLPGIAQGVDVDVPAAGHAISLYALGVVVGAPIFAVLGARMARRDLLMVLMAIFAAGNIASALAPGYASLLATRFLSGLPHGAYFGAAALVAAGMAGPAGRARAVGRVMLGLTIATLIGTPAVTYGGQILGWRAAFAFVGALGALTAVLVLLFVPRTAPDPGAGPLRELGALSNSQVWLTLGIAAIGMGGMFSIFSYVTPTMTAAGVPLSAVPLALVLFGVGMNIGNIVGSRLADRALMPTILGCLLWMLAVQVTFALFGGFAIPAMLTFLLLGTGFAVVPAIQTRLMDVARDAQTLAAALNHSAFNIANALGAWLGGLAIGAGYGWTSTAWVGAALTLGGIGVFILSALSDQRRSAVTA